MIGGRGGDGVVRCCRLLAVTDQIGALMGREGKMIDKIRRDSGAYIRVLTPEQLPSLANSDDELIQITGGSIAVRKALVAVSKCLQENPPKVTTSSYGAFKLSHLRNEFSLTPFPGKITMLPSIPYPSFTDRDLYHHVEGSIIVEVVFKMLCFSDIAGSVIGKGGSLVKALQEETGASIYFAAPVAGCQERVITISALENIEAQQSPAQFAVLRVFARAREALIKNALVSKCYTSEGVFSRLIIPSNQAGSLIGVRGTVVSDLQRVTNTKIQVLEGNQVPRCASSDERVVQISGDYAHVQNALGVITNKLRENIFSSRGLNVVQIRNYASYPVPNFVPPRKVEDGSTYCQASEIASSINGSKTLEYKLQNLNIGQDVDGLHMSHNVPCQNCTGQTGVTPSTGMAEVSSGETSAATVTNMTVEVVVPQKIFSSVFDDDGEKLARLKEISGATIQVEYPISKNDGKVIISGTPIQTLSGRSILQLYIVSAK